MLQAGSRRPHRTQAAFDAAGVERLKEILHCSPREFGKPLGLWTPELAAEVCFEQGVMPRRVSGETVRATLARVGIRRGRAKRRITGSDPAYQ